MSDNPSELEIKAKTQESVSVRQEERLEDNRFLTDQSYARFLNGNSQELSGKGQNEPVNPVLSAIGNKLEGERYRVSDELRIEDAGAVSAEETASYHSVASKYEVNVEGEHVTKLGLLQKKERVDDQSIRKTKPEAEVEQGGELYQPPKEMESALKQKKKLEAMPVNDPKEKAAYDKRNKKYITVRRSCIKAYINTLYKEKGGYIDRQRKDYLDLAADLSYYMEKERAGIPDEDRPEKIAKIVAKMKSHPLYNKADRFMPGYLRGELYAGTDSKIAEIVSPHGEEEVQKAEPLQKEAKQEETTDPAKWDEQVTELFTGLCGVIKDEHYDSKTHKVVEDEIWSRIRVRDNEDSVTYNQFRSAVLRVKKLVQKSGSDSDPEARPGAAELMAAMARLSETANAFYDTHRGHQYSQKGKDRRKACDMVRQITKEFYDRMYAAMGGTGLSDTAVEQSREKTGKDHRDVSAWKMKELSKVYGKWKKHFALQEGLERVRVRDRAKLFGPYMRYIDMYKATHKKEEWPKEIEEAIRDASFYSVQNRVHENYEKYNGGMKDPLLSLAKKHVETVTGRTAPEQKLDPKKVDAKLSPEQLRGLDFIDQWFLRNYNNGGMVGSLINIRNHHGEIVSELFSKTKRERLFIYYLIETGKRKNPGVMDLFSSQTYIPNLDRFKDQMLASKFKIMSHIMGDYTYMGKVTEAIQVNQDYGSLIKDCARLDQGVDEVKGEELEALKQKKEEYRTYTLARTAHSTKAFRDEALRVEGLGKKATKADRDSLNKKQQAFLKDLDELIRADDAVGEAVRYGESLGETVKSEDGGLSLKENDKYYSVKNTNLTDLAGNTSTYAAAGEGVSGNVHIIANGAILYKASVKQGLSLAKGKGYNPTFWRLRENKNSFMNPSTYGSTITAATISSLGSLLGVCYGVHNLVTNWDSMHAYDRAATVSEILQSGGSAVNTVMTTVDTAKDLSKGLEATTSTLTKTVGISVSGLKAGKDLYSTVSGHLDCRNADNAKKLLQDKINERFLRKLSDQGDGSIQEGSGSGSETEEQKTRTEKDFRAARYENNMLKLSRDISERKRDFAGIQAVGSFMTVAGLTVPVVGSVLSLAGMAISSLTGIFSGMSLTEIREKMFDQYFQFDSFLKDAYEEMEKRGQPVSDPEEFKVRMRRVVAASAGYADVISACDQIAKTYADLICRGLFGGEEDRVEGEQRDGYIQIVKSFGLPYDEKKKIPDPDLLARRMNGK